MKVKLKWGDPMFPNSHEVVILDLYKPWQQAQEAMNLGYIHSQLKYHPFAVQPGAVFGDGLNIYRVLEVSGPKLMVDEIYTSQNPKCCKPVKILAMHQIAGIRFYTCEICYRGETRRHLKTERSLLNHLRGRWWLSWLP